MRILNIAMLTGFLVAGTLPWFSLGPASTLGVTGWGSGIAAIFACAAGAGAVALSHLADKGMPTKADAIGPRFGAGLLALTSLVSVITWLCLSPNTQAVIGTESVPLYLGPGAPVAAILAMLAVIITGYELVISPERIPTSLTDAFKKATQHFNTSKTRQGASNNPRTTRPAPKKAATAGKPVQGPAPPARRQPPAAVGTEGRGSSAVLHVPAAPSVQPPRQGPKRPPQGSEGPAAGPEPLPGPAVADPEGAGEGS